MTSLDYRCIACDWDGGPPTFYKQRASWQYFQCPNCGLVSLKPLPDTHELQRFYNDTYSVDVIAYEEGAKRNAPAILDDLRRRYPAKGRLLEVGSSYGFFLREAQSDGWDVTGIELNEAAARYSRDKLGLNAITGTLEYESERLKPAYDVIVSFHVIEHLPDPGGFLDACRRLLCPGGSLVLKTPNISSWAAKRTGANWSWLSPPAHLHLFSPASLDAALRRSGFKLSWTSSQRGDAGNNLYELVYGVGRYLGSRGGGEPAGKGTTRTTKARIIKAATELIYMPAGLLLDRWLGEKGLQPELVTIAQLPI